MVPNKVKGRFLFILLAVVICLCVGMIIFAQCGDAGNGVKGCDQGIRAFGEAYNIFFGDNQIVIFDNQNAKLLDYKISDSGDRIVSSCISDLDKDETDEILLIIGNGDSEYGTELLILEMQAASEESRPSDINARLGIEDEGVRLKVIYKKDMSYINPWKVQTCDVDGDGSVDISIGAYKTARFHPVMAKRPFIYNWQGDSISPKWLGSRLSRPFDDYVFMDINSDGADEIISIEHLVDGKKAVNSYSWKGFGFESIGESKAYNDILSIRRSETTGEGKQAVSACVMVDGQEQWIKMIHYNGALSEIDGE